MTTTHHQPQQQPELTVIVVNYRTAALTVGCLKTLARQRVEVPTMQVIVVDNQSADGSVFALSAAISTRGWSDWVQLIESPENFGFAGGNNLAIERVLQDGNKPEFMLLLNSDTEVTDGCLRRCLDHARSEQNLGVMSCLLLNRDGSPQNTARKFPRPDREVARALGLPWLAPFLLGSADLEDADWDRRTESRDVDWLGGAFLLVPTSVMTEIGGLDDDFFFYGEDIVFSYRVKQLGYRALHWPGASTTHFGGGSSDASRLPSRWRTQCIWRGRLLVQRKCYGHLAEKTVQMAYLAAMWIRKAKIIYRGGQGKLEDQKVDQGLSILAHPFKEAVQ